MKIVTGNILELLPRGALLFHQVNTLGVFGAGLARQIRDKWPSVAKSYHAYTANASPCLGDHWISVVEEDGDAGYKSRHVVHCYAQDGVGTDKRYTHYTSLAKIFSDLRMTQQPCYFPYKMGCGLAGGDWNIVSVLIEENFPDAVIVRLP